MLTLPAWYISPPPPHKNALFPHNRFSTHFFSMKMAELGGTVLVSCIIDFDDIQLCPRQFCLNLNICKVMTIFFKFWPKKIRKTVITLQILRFKQNCLSQSWISSKSIMQLTKTIFQNFANFIEKEWLENRLWGKRGFCGGKELIHSRAGPQPVLHKKGKAMCWVRVSIIRVFVTP